MLESKLMDPESKKLLEDTYNLAEENNKMLRKVRGVQKREAIFSGLKWLVVIIIGVGSFYFLQPYIDFVKEFVTSAGATLNKIDSILPR